MHLRGRFLHQLGHIVHLRNPRAKPRSKKPPQPIIQPLETQRHVKGPIMQIEYSKLDESDLEKLASEIRHIDSLIQDKQNEILDEEYEISGIKQCLKLFMHRRDRLQGVLK